MKYPKYNVYEQIYKNYFKRSVYDLINKVEIKSNDKVIDICGGNGRLSKELITLSKNVSYLDQELNMIPKQLITLGIKVYNKSVKEFLLNNKNKYDKVFCQQAINYWLLDIDMYQFSKMFKKNGIFVFNTFNTKPSEKPIIKNYELDGLNYLEVSYLVKNKVYHVQICEGFEPHFTVFDWISKKKFLAILNPYFDVSIINDKKTDIYICRSK